MSDQSNRQALEKQALDLVAGRGPVKVQPKPKMSGMAKLSIGLWIAAIVMIGSLAGYMYLLK